MRLVEATYSIKNSDMRKLVVAFRSFAKAPENDVVSIAVLWCYFINALKKNQWLSLIYFLPTGVAED
jgi:hypothetical protein